MRGQKCRPLGGRPMPTHHLEPRSHTPPLNKKFSDALMALKQVQVLFQFLRFVQLFNKALLLLRVTVREV